MIDESSPVLAQYFRQDAGVNDLLVQHIKLSGAERTQCARCEHFGMTRDSQCCHLGRVRKKDYVAAWKQAFHRAAPLTFIAKINKRRLSARVGALARSAVEVNAPIKFGREAAS
jgi:hypothetical protein